jgi:hypothetical protein
MSKRLMRRDRYLAYVFGIMALVGGATLLVIAMLE